jgi:hypothetical protein
MPAKKTFQSSRFRGPSQFDVVPTVKGTPIVPYTEYTAVLSNSGGNGLQINVLLNTTGKDFVWSNWGEGLYKAVVPGGLPLTKTAVQMTHGMQNDIDFSVSCGVHTNGELRLVIWRIDGGEFGRTDFFGVSTITVRIFQ